MHGAIGVEGVDAGHAFGPFGPFRVNVARFAIGGFSVNTVKTAVNGSLLGTQAGDETLYFEIFEFDFHAVLQNI